MSLYDIAVHEWHTRWRTWLSLPLTSVPIGKGTGFKRHGELIFEDLSGDALFRHAVATLAGPTGVRVLRPRSATGDKGDERDAVMLLAKVATDDFDPWIARARAQAVELVGKRARESRAIAAAVLKGGERDAPRGARFIPARVVGWGGASGTEADGSGAQCVSTLRLLKRHLPL